MWLGVKAVEAINVSDEELRKPLEGMHKAMQGLWDRAVQAQVKRAASNRKRRGAKILPRINVGDMVLVAETVQPHKLSMQWTGPHQVTAAVSPFVYKVIPMVREQGRRKPKLAHIVLIRRFSAGKLATKADRDAIEQEAMKDYPDNFPQKIVGHERGPPPKRELMLKVRWLGYDAAHDTPEPISNLVEDASDMVQEYLQANRKDKVCATMLRRYFP